jgi:hypothetical protein
MSPRPKSWNCWSGASRIPWETHVEKALKYRYAAIVAAAPGRAARALRLVADRHVVAKAVGPLPNDAQRSIARMNLHLELAKDRKVRPDDLLEQIEVRAGEAQKRLESLSRKVRRDPGSVRHHADRPPGPIQVGRRRPA